MSATCGKCGKEFVILYPHLWSYKREDKVFCSWKCLRAWDRGKEAGEEMNDGKKSQLEIGKQLIAAMAEGADPNEWLKEHGYTNTSKAYGNIKRCLTDKAPELAEKMPNRRSQPRKKRTAAKTAEKKPEPKEAKTGGDEFEVMTIRSKASGVRYEWSKDYNLFAIRYKGDELTMHLDELTRVLDEMPRVMKILGVEV